MNKTNNDTNLSLGNDSTVKLNPVLKSLAVLIGKWTLELSFPTNPSNKFFGKASFEWLEEGAFPGMHTGNKKTGLPYSSCVIGRDESTDIYSILYTDNRGVSSRIYQMSFAGHAWRQWRNGPGFSPRFMGNIDENNYYYCLLGKVN